MSWILWAAGVLGCGVIGELALRRWLSRSRQCFVWLPGVRQRLYTDRAALPEFEPVLRIDINTDGERGPDAPPADPGLYRVLAAGGSAVEGHSLDQSTNWPTLVAERLNVPDSLLRLGATRAHVGGIGRSAVTARDVDLILQRVLPRYPSLDAVLLMIGAGDVVKWLACGAPANAPAPPGAVEDLFAWHPEGPFGWRPAETALVRLGTRWRRRWWRRVEVRHGVGRWIVEARAMRVAATETRSEVGDPSVMLDHFARYLKSSLLRASARAGRVLLLRTPWFEKDYTSEEAARLWHGAMGHPWRRQRISVYYTFEVVNRLMALMDARAAQVTQELGIEQVDLKPLIEPTLENYYDYTHFTPAGARVVAHAVSAALLRQASAGSFAGTSRRRERTTVPL